MTKEEQLKILSAYFPHNLQVRVDKDTYILPDSKRIGKITQINLEEGDYELVVTSDKGYFLCDLDQVKPILFPLYMLTQEIEHEGERFIPIDYFEISDEQSSYNIEFDSGNIRLINDLTDIAKHNISFDIKFLPFEVVNKLTEWHFNVFNLSEVDFINKATLKTK